METVTSANGDVDISLRPHIRAIQASVGAGFRFLHRPTLGVIRGFRGHAGVIDVFDAWDTREASAFRFRAEDFGGRDALALWSRRGWVADVVSELLELPPHGAPGTPTLARRRVTDLLWVPLGAAS